MRVTHTQKGAIMPRTEIELMEGWEFTRSQTGDEESCFHPVMLPHDWVIGAPLTGIWRKGRPRVSGSEWESAGIAGHW